MRHVLVFASSLSLLQLLACGSDDDKAPANTAIGGKSGSSVAQGGTSNDNTTSLQGGTSSTSGGTVSTATGSSGGMTSSTGTTGGPADSALTPSSPYAGKLSINELCPSNKTIAEEGGSYPDWLELFNSSSQDISLKGFYVTDDNANLSKFQISADALVVKAGGVLVLWADGDSDETEFHLSFSLSAAGETLSLLDPDQKVVDSVTWSGAQADRSYTRLPDGSGAFAWCGGGTPNLKNGTACK